jgi:glucosamine--fructose-6-phosphate aminotransferase (isomerizing)
MSERLYDLNVDVKLAIAHNRLPSVGNVCLENTHPFIDCNGYLALAHNGHVFTSNLREWLIENGHKILGETDSEVLTHVLEEYFDETSDMLQAVAQLTVNHLIGSIVVITLNNEIYCAKCGYYPLHYTTVDGEVYVASSKNAIERLLKALNIKHYEIIEVQDYEILKIRDGKVEHYKIKLPNKYKSYFPYFEF